MGHFKKTKPQTTLALLCNAIRCNQEDLAKDLKLPPSTFASYCRGDRNLPRLPCLDLLSTEYGVDPDSLVPPPKWKKGDPFQKPRTVTGCIISAEFCRKWKEHRQMDEEEVSVAFKQLQPVLKATLLCLSKRHPSKARVLLGKINSAINDAIDDEGLRADFKEYFKHPDFGTTTVLDRITKKADLEEVEPRIYGYIKDRWLKKVAELDPILPVRVVLRERLALTTPNRRVDKNYLDMRSLDQLLWEKYGLGSICTTVSTYTVTQGRRSWSFDFWKGEIKVSKQLLPDFQPGESNPTPTSATEEPPDIEPKTKTKKRSPQKSRSRSTS